MANPKKKPKVRKVTSRAVVARQESEASPKWQAIVSKAIGGIAVLAFESIGGNKLLAYISPLLLETIFVLSFAWIVYSIVWDLTGRIHAKLTVNVKTMRTVITIFFVALVIFPSPLWARNIIIDTNDTPNLVTNGSKEVTLSMGLLHFISKWYEIDNHPKNLIYLDSYIPLKLEIVNGKPVCDVTIYDKQNNLTVQIFHNDIADLPVGWDENINPNAFEVINIEGVVIFQMVYVTEYDINIKGIFPFEGTIMISDDYGFRYNSPPFVSTIAPIFKYPSSKYPGKLA